LVLLAFPVALAQFAAIAMEHRAGQAVARRWVSSSR
jgi:hypothetical protein